MSTFILHLPSGGIEISQSDNGWLRCTKCSSIWCKHIETAVTNNLDAEVVWEHSVNSHVVVPVVPTQDVWVSVEMVESKTILDCREIQIISPVDGFQHEGSIGRIYLGEGRGVIRDLITNWFILQWANPYTGLPIEPRCSQGTHKFIQEMKFKENMQAGGKYRELWSLYWFKSCASCQAILDADNSDLIPTADRPF